MNCTLYILVLPLEEHALPWITGRVQELLQRRTDEDEAARSATAARTAAAAITNSDFSPSKRARKDRGPNWQTQEIVVLIQAKRRLFLEELNIVDTRDIMYSDFTKWMRISEEVMEAGHSPCLRDGPACKSKWNQLVPEYKRIADFFARSGTNSMDYWNMNPAERKAEGLPRSFAEDVFHSIHEWFGTRPNMLPERRRDLLVNNDYYQHKTPANTHSTDNEGPCDVEAEDAMDIAQTTENSSQETRSAFSPVHL